MFDTSVLIPFAASIVLVVVVYLISKSSNQANHDHINHLAVKTALQFAVLKFVNNRDEYKEKIKEIVELSLKRLEDEELTNIDEINNVITKTIPWDKVPDAEKLLIKNLIELVLKTIEQKYKENLILDGQHNIQASEILNWILEVVE